MFELLLRCAASDPERARVGRIQAGILLIFFVLTLVASGGSLLFGTHQINPVVFVALVLIALLYVLNRRGGVTSTAIGLAATFMGVMLAIGMNPQGTLPVAILAAAGLVIPVALAGVLLPWRWVIGMILAATAGALLLFQGLSPQLAAYWATHGDE